ncbi:MAG: heme exporter protein CcmB [Pseudomonadota bacterium]
MSFRAFLSRDLNRAFRAGGGWFYGLFFFALFSTAAGLVFGPAPTDLRASAPAVIWLGAAMALLMGASDVFAKDADSGFILILFAESESAARYLAAKAAFVLIVLVAPITLSAIPIAVMFSLPLIVAMTVAALLGAGLVGVGAVALFSAALSAGLRVGGLLPVSLATPIAAPLLIFGSLATKTIVEGGSVFAPETLLVLALACVNSAILPPFILWALRAGVD